MDFFDELFEKIPDKKVKQEKHQTQQQQNQKIQQDKPKVQPKQKIQQNQKKDDYPQFTEEQQLRNALNKLDLVTISKENLYQQLPESKISMQFEMDRYKYLLQTLIGDDNLINEKIEQKGFLLSKFEKPFQLKNQVEKQQTPIKNNFQRQLKVFKKKIKDVTYASVFPMHQLWKLYLTDLISQEKIQDNIYLKLLKADFHGALIMVYKAKCKSQEGIEGIVISERLKTFLIITEENKLLTLPKDQIVFLIKVDDKYYKVQGQQIIYRPSDRAKIKFKYH
ncbi:hypothetical protein pb186bvf_012804 [Paramecium bursaria]